MPNFTEMLQKAVLKSYHSLNIHQTCRLFRHSYRFCRFPRRGMATEASHSEPPPPPPPQQRGSMVRNLIIGTGILTMSWVYLKPWHDYESFDTPASYDAGQNRTAAAGSETPTP